MKNKKRLLIFHPYLATYRIDVYNRLAKDYEVKVILTGHPNEISGLGFTLEKINEQAQFDYHYYNKGRYIGRHLLSTIYFKAIKEFKPDVVLAHEYGLNTLAAICSRYFYKFRLFITCDDSLQMAESYSENRKRLRNFVVKQVDGFLVVSTKTKIYLENLYPKARCKFIYFPIIQDDILLAKKINANRKKAESYSNEYSIGNKKILLYVGRFVSVKNLPLLLKAYAEVKKDDNLLVLVGDGEMKSIVDKMIHELGLEDNILQTGSLYGDDLYAWYYLADFFVLASYQEAFGAVVNEALVGGCFTLVSDHAGAHTLISDGINGYVFKSDDEKDLKKKMILTFDRAKKGGHCSLMPKSFEEFYQDIINGFESK